MKKLMSLILALVMLFSLAVPAMAAEGDTYYVVGEFNGWSFEPMTWNAAENRYEYVLTNVAATNIGEYIVRTTAVWSEGTGYNDNGVKDDSNPDYARYTVAEDGSTVTLCFDGTKTFAIVTAPGEEAAGPSVTGNKEGDVTANYTPVIKVTGMSIEGDNVTYDADTNTYTVVATENPWLDLVFSGTNLNYIAYEDSTYLLETTASDGEIVPSQLGVFFNSWYTYDEATGTMFENSAYPIGADVTYRFSNDGGATWEDGLRLVVKQGYAIGIFEYIEGGTVTADKAIAAEGDTVTLTVTPDEGYELGTLFASYSDAYGVDVEVEITDNKFVMPAGDVTVSAEFVQSTTTYTVTIDENIANGTVAVDPTTYTYGQTVTLTVTPAEGYVLDKLTVTNTATNEEVTVTDNSFTMPAANVNVTATFKKCYRIGAIFNGGGTVDLPPSAAEGENVTVDFTAMEGWELQYVEVNDRTSGQLIPHVMVDDNTFTFTMPAGEVDILFSFWKIGTDLETVYYKGPWTNMQVYFANDGSSVSDVIGVPTMVEAGIYAITNIPDHTAGLRIINADTNEWFDIESIPTDGRNMYNAETGEWETYTPSTPEDVTSASISWGSMSFTYTDGEDGAEGAWSADTTEGAGTVTVENTGTTTVTVSAVYTPETAYAEITGTLGDAKTLAATEKGTFTLNLSGKPNKALNGEKIGTVTVTIE